MNGAGSSEPVDGVTTCIGGRRLSEVTSGSILIVTSKGPTESGLPLPSFFS